MSKIGVYSSFRRRPESSQSLGSGFRRNDDSRTLRPNPFYAGREPLRETQDKLVEPPAKRVADIQNWYYYDGTLAKVPESKPTKGPPDIHVRVKQSKDRFCKYAYNDNHGVRESQILRLLFPVGIKEIDIDSTWLSTIDSLGSNRGYFAHTSIKISNPPDPPSELATVEQIVDGSKHIGDTLLEFLNKWGIPNLIER